MSWSELFTQTFWRSACVLNCLSHGRGRRLWDFVSCDQSLPGGCGCFPALSQPPSPTVHNLRTASIACTFPPLITPWGSNCPIKSRVGKPPCARGTAVRAGAVASWVEWAHLDSGAGVAACAGLWFNIGILAGQLTAG